MDGRHRAFAAQRDNRRLTSASLCVEPARAPSRPGRTGAMVKALLTPLASLSLATVTSDLPPVRLSPSLARLAAIFPSAPRTRQAINSPPSLTRTRPSHPPRSTWCNGSDVSRSSRSDSRWCVSPPRLDRDAPAPAERGVLLATPNRRRWTFARDVGGTTLTFAPSPSPLSPHLDAGQRRGRFEEREEGARGETHAHPHAAGPRRGGHPRVSRRTSWDRRGPS